MKFIGIDIAKKTFVVAYPAEKGYRTTEFLNNPKGVKKFISSFPHSEYQCVMEATGNYSTLLLYTLCSQGIAASLINPKQTKYFSRMMMATVKTDQADAELLALYGEKMHPEIYAMPSKDVQALKQKRLILRNLKKQLTALKNLKESFDALPDPDKNSLLILSKNTKFVKKQIGLVEADLNGIVTKSYEAEMKALTSIPGIGKRIASELLITTGAFSQFKNAKQVSRYIGLCPTFQRSGTSINIRGSINRNGDSEMRSLLYIATWTAIRYNKPCKDLYERLKAKGKASKVALIAVANKLLRQAFAVCKSGRIYSSDYHLLNSNFGAVTLTP